MPNSLKARLGKLKYKGIISDKDYERLCKALEKEPCTNCSIKYELEVNLKKWSDAYKRGLENGKEQPRWIPISERLPEDRREVLVTAYWHETYQVMMASYYGDGLWWCVPFNNCGEHMQKLKPKAWMPLSQPYMAESER